jgi:hypothetical protein
MYRVDLPYTTRTTGIDVLDFDNLFRQAELDSRLDMLNTDDGTFLKALDLWSTKPPVNQAVYRWVEDDILGISTQVNCAAGYAATITSIVVDDAKLFVVNSEIFVTRTLECMLVTGVTYATNTLTVKRGFNDSAAYALVDNDKLVAGVTHLPEMGDANLGTGRVPDTDKFNFVSRFSESFKISDMQEVAGMIETGEGKVATVTWETLNKMQEIKRKVNKALLFQHRGMSTTADGTLYVSQGFVHYIQDNVLNLGNHNSNLSWPILSDWIDTLCDPTASSREKMMNAGPWMFSAILRMQRDMSTQLAKYFHPQLNADVIDIVTEGGNTVMVVKDKHGFPASEGLAGWAVVVDMKHAFKREYIGEPMTWRQGIQHGAAHFRQDEYWGSFSLELRHPECHGYIRGAAPSIIDR